IFKYTPAGTRSTFISQQQLVAVSSRLVGPVDLAFDHAGNLFVTFNGNGSNGGGSIAKITPGGTASLFATGLFVPQGIVVDGQGFVYEADSFSGNVYRFDALGHRVTFT